MKADVITLDASSVGSIELSDDVFALEPRTDILQRMVRYQLAKQVYERYLLGTVCLV